VVIAPTLLKAGGGWARRAGNSTSRANGQFSRLTLPAILAALDKMQSLMSTYIAAPLKTINQYETECSEVLSRR